MHPDDRPQLPAEGFLFLYPSNYLMQPKDDAMRYRIKDITDKRIILSTKNSQGWQVVCPDPKSRNVEV
ncbi:MAG TPA: hypothetical protein DCP31_41625 [Cyanobacteria bacterium UBA8543]|nr:hypothetical protein [Cyanobacteria bacterium UBA8543]